VYRPPTAALGHRSETCSVLPGRDMRGSVLTFARAWSPVDTIGSGLQRGGWLGMLMREPTGS
jgi:hypothetical protein